MFEYEGRVDEPGTGDEKEDLIEARLMRASLRFKAKRENSREKRKELEMSLKRLSFFLFSFLILSNLATANIPEVELTIDQQTICDQDLYFSFNVVELGPVCDYKCEYNPADVLENSICFQDMPPKNDMLLAETRRFCLLNIDINTYSDYDIEFNDTIHDTTASVGINSMVLRGR